MHAGYTSVLSEAKTSTLLSAYGDPTGMRFGDHNVMWSFDPSNVYHARQLRDEYLSILYACGTAAGDFFAAELIYRELVTNALRYAPGKVTVELQWSEPYPVLSVHDQSDLFFWTGELPANTLKERGRGLYLVNSFARALQIKKSAGPGHKISAELPVERKCDLVNLFEFPDA
jgi:anti-sigma regulatory factor (Ser/Thr protein kinase)